MRRRIFGLETEYGLFGQGRYGWTAPTKILREMFAQNLIGDIFWGENIFLENGARIYGDYGGHPEYATPECDNPLQVVKYDKAGERILEIWQKELEEKMKKKRYSQGIKIFLLKNNVDSQNNAFGCHENYLLLRRDYEALFKSQKIKILISFLVSRQIFTGSGRVLPNGEFLIFQKAPFIERTLSISASEERAIINLRDEPLSPGNRFSRLHLILGDSNMSEIANFLKLETTHLVLRMLEEKDILKEIILESPLKALWKVAKNVEVREKFFLKNGSKWTALKIQRYFLEKAQSFLEKSFAYSWEKKVLLL